MILTSKIMLFRSGGAALAAVSLLLMALGGKPEAPEALEQEALRALRERRYQEALSAFEKLLVLSPQRSLAHYGRGLALSGLQNYAAAAEALERAVSLDVTHAAAWRWLVVLYARIGRMEAVLEAYRKARQLGPLPAEDRLGVARALRLAGATATAREVLEEVPPETRTAGEHAQLGLLALNEAEYEAAARHFREATRQPDRSEPETEHMYAMALEALGQTDQSLLHYRRVLEKQPRHRRARFRLGNLLLRSGQAEEGRALLRGYEEFRQWDRAVLTLLGQVSSGQLDAAEHRDKSLKLVDLLLQEGQVEDAARFLQPALARNPDDRDFRTAYARWHFAAGRPQEARELLEPILSVPSPPIDALRLSASLHLLAGQAAQALEAFERLLSVDKDPAVSVLRELAKAYALNGRAKEAEATLNRALEREPSLAEAHLDLGSLLQAEGRATEAEDRLQRALAIDPGLVSAQRALGVLLLRRGDAAGAERLLQKCVRSDPKDPRLRRDLADALAALGRSEEAETQRKAALEIESDQRP